MLHSEAKALIAAEAKIKRKAWYQRNKAKFIQDVKVRQKKMEDQRVSWRYRQQIQAIYDEARRMTEETGILHVVDHIWPLNHPLCCGLHVPWNLQVITFAENAEKGNKLPANAHPVNAY